ncbi:hypothetical protein [Actinomadura sp. NPDC000600]|uniref:hypothetical protein n=1 Tax=Actinomadura sp. NPDC000600 TaxID=3154262 RepID=UPI0033954AFA
MHANELATTAVEVLADELPGIADGAARARGDAALADLYDLVRQRLVRDGRHSAFAAYTMNPRNNALVQDVLRQAAETDAAFAAALLDAVRRAHGSAPGPSRSSGVSTGDIGSVTGSITAAGRDINDNSEKKTTVNTGGVVLLVAGAVAALFVFVFVIKAATADAITADSTCAEFLDADAETQQHAIIKIAREKGVSGAGSPLAPLSIRYDCSSAPDAKVGDIIARSKGF